MPAGGTLDATNVPDAAKPFVRNGTYVGSYPSLQTLATNTLALDALAHPELARLDPPPASAWTCIFMVLSGPSWSTVASTPSARPRASEQDGHGG